MNIINIKKNVLQDLTSTIIHDIMYKYFGNQIQIKFAMCRIAQLFATQYIPLD